MKGRRKDETYEFYNNNAKGKRFNIRKGKVRKSLKNDEVIWRRLLYSWEGYTDVQYFDRKDQKRKLRSLTHVDVVHWLISSWVKK
jgi:hypothetical protein